MLTQFIQHAIIEPHYKGFTFEEGTILKNWKKNKVVSLKDIEALDALHQEKAAAAPKRTEAAASTTKKNQFNNFTQRSYDTSELEKELLGYGSH